MNTILTGTRLILALTALLSIVGVVGAAARGELTLSMSLIPLTGWLAIVAARPERLPFFTNDVAALGFFRIGFFVLAVVFLAMTLWITSLQLPRVLAKQYEGTIVGLDDSHIGANGYRFPIVQFSTEDGSVHRFSNFSPADVPLKKSAHMPPIHVGDKIKVIENRGRYVALVRNEIHVFWFVFGVPLVASLICASVSVVASARMLGLRAGP